jgi:hypothetical protein
MQLCGDGFRGTPRNGITKGFSNDLEPTAKTPIYPAEAEVASSNLAGRIKRKPRKPGAFVFSGSGGGNALLVCKPGRIDGP